MARPLTDYRLVFVAPAEGQTAVGDYAQNFVDAVRPHFGEVVERRTGGPGTDTVRDIRRHRRAVADLVAGAPAGRVLVHAELSTGVLATFWSTAGLKGVPVTSTVHDPPQGPWLPARTEFIARSRLLTHGIHYPLRPVSRALEGAVYGDRTLFALTETGRRATARTYPKAHTFYVPHLVRERPAVRPAQERPKAVGFFGLVYRGKGFEQIAKIRRQLPADVLIRVAGRGTELLPHVDGVEILGGVDGPQEDAFFDSVRAIVVPYGKRHFYAETYPASGVVAHATAYRTPVVSTDYGSLAELGTETGTVVVPTHGGADADTVAHDLAAAAAALVNDEVQLTTLGANSEATRQARSGPRVAEEFVTVWADMLALQSEGV
jgi:glycosyltransferase involved in cell wall biosynthesis